MADQKIGVTLDFKANTTSAKNSVTQLQTQLQKLSAVPPIGVNAEQIKQASIAAQQLQKHISAAVNVDTGKLNLAKLNTSIRSTGDNFVSLTTSMLQGGQLGTQAFISLAQAVSQSGAPVIRLQGLVEKLWISLKNVATWQFSSGILMGFISSIQEAYRYVQDLNESLNNIRIVTGQSIEQMEQFAIEANKAAKVLNTTTNEYAKASLIYYQQGLSDKEVKARTDLTIKMANVTRQSAQTVSDQLTAIWNNFYDGTKSLEYYIDVITALGAATASSSDEISEGLNKFAAVAETVGLSYDYAASALATVTATTRQSADVVGTAFKTLFARIQDLELGETLDDGTTLGKYSQALSAVGIEIKDVNGDIKDMNDILDEMGAKWNALSKDAQIALAQNVAGVRQYTQLIALMDNWDYFQENLDVAKSSTGTLEKQAETYAESWEAARDRVSAAAEELYTKLLDDDTFIDILNFIESLIEGANDFIDALGGIKPILTGIIGMLVTSLSTKITPMIQSTVASLTTMTAAGQNKAINKITSPITDGIDNQLRTNSALTMSEKASLENAKQLIVLKQQLNQQIHTMTKGERWLAESQLSQIEEQFEAREKMYNQLDSINEKQTAYLDKLQAESELITTIADKEAARAKVQDNSLRVSKIDKNLQNTLFYDNQKKVSTAKIAGYDAEIDILRQKQAGLNQTSQAYLSISEKIVQLETKKAEWQFKQEQAARNLQVLAQQRISMGIDTKGLQMTGIQNALEQEKAALESQAVVAKEVYAEVAASGVQAYEKIAKAAIASGNKNNINAVLKGSANIQASDAFGKFNISTAPTQKDLELVRTKLLVIKDLLAKVNKEDILKDFTDDRLSLENLTQSVQELNSALDAGQLNAAELNQILAHTGQSNTVKPLTSSLAQLSAQLEANEKEALRLKQRIAELEKQLKQTQSSYNPGHTQGTLEGITRVSGGLMSLSMGIQQIQSLGSIWKNNDASTGQKILSTIMAVSMALPALISGVQALGVALNVSLWPITAVLAALTALVLLFEIFDTESRTFQDDLNDAGKAAEMAAEQFNTLTEAAEKAKEAVSNWEDAVDSLKELKEGTEEYTEALKKANEQARNLISVYSLQKGTDYETINGVLTITEIGLEKIESRMEAATRNAEMAKQTADLYVLQLQEKGVLATAGKNVSNTTVAYAYENEYKATQNKAAELGLSEGQINTLMTAYLRSQENTALREQHANTEGYFTDTELQALYNSGKFDKNKDADSIRDFIEWFRDEEIQVATQSGYRFNSSEMSALVDTYRQGALEGKTDDELLSALEQTANGFESFTGTIDNDLLNSIAKISDQLEENTAASRAVAEAFYANVSKGILDFSNTASSEQNENLMHDIVGVWQAEQTGDTNPLVSFLGEQYIKASKDDDDEANAVNQTKTLGIEQGLFTEQQWTEAIQKAFGDTSWAHIGEDDDETMRMLYAYNAATNVYGKILSAEDKDGEIEISFDAGNGIETKTISNEAISSAYIQQLGSALQTVVAEDKLVQEDSSFQAIFSAIEKMTYGGESFSTEILSSIKNNNGKINFGNTLSLLSQSEAVALQQMSEDEILNTFGLNELEIDWEKIGFENAEQFAKAFKAGAKNWSEEAYIKAQNAKGSRTAKELELDVDEFESYREQLELTYSAYKDNVEGLNAVALANKRLSRGVETLTKDWDNLNLIMSDSTSTPEELSKILPTIEKGLKDILNLDDEKFELLPDDFAQKNWQLIQDVVNGVEGAVDELRDAAGQNILLTITGVTDFSQVDISLQTLHNKLLEFDQEKFEVGVEISQSDKFFKLCDEMVRKARKSSAEMQAYFAAMGYDVELVTDKDGKATALKVITPSGSYGGGLGVTTAATSTDKKPKDKKVLEDEVDRYHEIKEQLSDIERELKAISKAKDRAFGGDKLKLMKAEMEKTEEMARAQQQYLDDIRAKAQTDQAAANAVGISTDASGRISNYEEALQAAIDRYNTVVTKQNASDDEIEKAEKEYEKFIKTLEQYEETLNLLEDEQEKLIDLQNQMKDQALEKITYEVEIKVKVSDNELKALERMLKKLDDPVNDAADAISLLSKTLTENLKKVDAYADGVKNIFASVLNPEQIDQLLAGDFSVLDGISLTDAQISKLEKYRDSLYDTEDAINEFYGSVMKQVNAAFEAHNEDAEKSITKIERLTSVLDTYQNVIDLVGQKALGMNADTLKALSKAKVDAAQTQLESLQTQLKANEDMLASSQTALEQAQTDEEKEYWQKQVETQQEKVEELKEAVNQSWVDTLQAAADDFALAVETTKTAFEEAMAGIYGTFEKMQEAYAQQQEAGDRYLDTYKQVYELSKLNRDLNKSIDSTDSIKGKQALRDLQEEINRLQESDAEMSQYDLDYLRKKYDLRVAEIALEEAQNAKSQVRMQRDAEGNWGYVYTADESKTADAAQNYEDKLYAIQELSSGYIDSMEEKIIQAEIDMAQKAAEIRREDYASEEEYQKAVNDVTKYYSELRNYYISEMQKALGNNKDIYNSDWLAYSEYSGKVLDADNGWRTQFSETFIAQRNGYTSIEQDRAAFESATTTMAGNLATAFSQWQSAASLAFQTVGHDFKAFGAEDGEMATAVNAIVGKLEGIGKEMDTWGEDAKSNFKKITDAAAGEFTAFSAEIDKYIGKSQAMIDAINKALQKQAEAEGQDYNPSENKENPGKSEAIEPPPKDSPPVEPPENPVEPPKNIVEPKTAYFLSRGEDTLEYEVNGTRYGQLSNGFYAKMEDILDRGNQVSVNDYMPGETEYVINIDKIQTYTMDELGIDDETWTVWKQQQYKNKKPNISTSSGGSGGGGWRGQFMTKMNTGGYTGAWGPEGRIAMLHEKELVLNPDDTANFLSAINIVRDIASLIDLRAAAQQSALSMMSATSIAPTTQTLQQEVTIHAEFPNATQRTEIEAAFDTLLNRASQFANRKNK